MATTEDTRWMTKTERRQRIIDDRDLQRATQLVLGNLHTIHGQSWMLCQDATRENRDLVLSIATAILEIADDARDLLDQNWNWDGKPTVDRASDELADLKARCAALGYRLFVDTDGTQLVTDTTEDGIDVIFIHESELDDDLEGWIADRERVSERVRQEARGAAGRAKARGDDPGTVVDIERDTREVLARRHQGPNEAFAEHAGQRIDALNRARDVAQIEVREISELIDAARTVDDDVSGDGRIRACLDVARKRLLQIANDLDSVNFGRVEP